MQTFGKATDNVKKITGSSGLHVIQVMATGFVVVALLVLLTSIYSIYGRRPPVRIASLDPPLLVNTCSGTRMLISLDVRITSPAIVTYYVSVMNKTQEKHLVGTQQIFRGFNYPVTGHFFQSLPWHVPELPSGSYVRVVSAIGSNGNDKPEMVVTKFDISKRCGKYDHRRVGQESEGGNQGKMSVLQQAARN